MAYPLPGRSFNFHSRSMAQPEFMNRLTAENIFVSVGRKEILKGVAISAAQGKITGLLGRNGSGKSTLLRTIFGTQKSDDQNIQVKGRAIRSAYKVQGLLNFLPSQPMLPGNLEIKTILAHYGIMAGQIVNSVPELEDDLEKRVFELAGGHERLWSALLLIYADTLFTMLDEPFTHLGPVYIERLKEILRTEKERKGIIITDHMHRHLLEVSDDLFLMKEGKTIYCRNSDDLVVHGYLSKRLM